MIRSNHLHQRLEAILMEIDAFDKLLTEVEARPPLLHGAETDAMEIHRLQKALHPAYMVIDNAIQNFFPEDVPA
jgi:hypothetical protein